MAGVSAKDIPEIQNMYMDIWDLHKKYYIAEDNDEFWQKLYESAHEIYDKYKTEICREYLKVVQLDIYNRFKEAVKHG